MPFAPAKQQTVTEPATGPDCGAFRKGGQRKCFACEAHTFCGWRGCISEAEVTSGNIHDGGVFAAIFELLVKHYPEAQVVTADAGYKTSWICKQFFDSGRIPLLPSKQPMTKKGNLPLDEYVCDEYYGCTLRPQNQLLICTAHREGCWEYRSRICCCKAEKELQQEVLSCRGLSRKWKCRLLKYSRERKTEKQTARLLKVTDALMITLL